MVGILNLLADASGGERGKRLMSASDPRVPVWHTQRQTRNLHQLMIQSKMDAETLAGFTARMVGELTIRGLDPALAFEAQKSVMALVTGWTMMPNGPAFRESPPEQSFLQCLDAMIRGWDQARVTG